MCGSYRSLSDAQTASETPVSCLGPRLAPGAGPRCVWAGPDARARLSPAPGAPRAPRAPRPAADVSFPRPLHLPTPPTRVAPEVPPRARPVAANQLLQRFLELAARFGAGRRGSERRLPIGWSAGPPRALIGGRAAAFWHACAASRTWSGGGGDRVSFASSPAAGSLGVAVHPRRCPSRPSSAARPSPAPLCAAAASPRQVTPE